MKGPGRIKNLNTRRNKEEGRKKEKDTEKEGSARKK